MFIFQVAGESKAAILGANLQKCGWCTYDYAKWLGSKNSQWGESCLITRGLINNYVGWRSVELQITAHHAQWQVAEGFQVTCNMLLQIEHNDFKLNSALRWFCWDFYSQNMWNTPRSFVKDVWETWNEFAWNHWLSLNKEAMSNVRNGIAGK